jgi:hypothetical protein
MELDVFDFWTLVVYYPESPPVCDRCEEWSWVSVQAVVIAIVDEVCYERDG